MTKHTPTECLASITITSSHFEDCDSLDEEFKVIKKIYHEKILREHPVRSCLDPIWNYTFVLMDFVSGLKYNIIGIHSFLIIN